ncbi:MAG: flagellar basal-body rod protein FlgF [Gammaproteobacteria bacterium]|nr:flagellar basal-body rod protein FlgF [Gammaproteobacteria bacterium]MDH5728576.1 flagellar basal-body rod protein FlgF [Gammaproteobacteria bacterium]
MFTSVYSGLSGMLSFSKGLDVLSDNIANLNTPGYKGNDLLFNDLIYQYRLAGSQGNYASQQIGNGVQANQTTTFFGQGDIQNTGNDTDVALDGNGFFVLRDGQHTYYTRAGQFEVDDDGYLISKVANSYVMGLSNGSLSKINVKQYRIDPPSATSIIQFTNNLSIGSSSHVVNNINVFDSDGGQHQLRMTFTNNNAVTPRSWLIDVEDQFGNILLAGGEIRYQGNGSPEAGFNSVNFAFSPSGVASSNVTLDFGADGTFVGSTGFIEGTVSTLSVDSADGHQLGSQTTLTFDEDGNISVNYSNGQSRQFDRLAIANFDSLQSLKRLSNSRFEAVNGQSPTLGYANLQGMGKLVAGGIESSNVELTQQFTDMIIIQRGYQASSQILTTANEMIQQLLDMAKGR